MKGFMFGYFIIYLVDLTKFTIYGSINDFRTSTKKNDAISIFYLALLEFKAFIAIADFYYRNEIPGLVELILVKLEVFGSYIYIYLLRKFYIPLFTYSTSAILLAFYILIYWPDVYEMVLQNYSKRIGVGVDIKNIYIIRQIYAAVKSLTYTLFIVIVFLHTFLQVQGFKAGFLIMTIPVFLIKVLERKEEEEEDLIAKYIIIILFIVLSLYSIYETIALSYNNNETEIQLLYYLNSYHFVLSTLLSITDRFTYKKGLKEALNKIKVKEQREI